MLRDNRSVTRDKGAVSTLTLPLALAVALWTPLAAAQSNLGELLDAGARKLSPEEFKEEVVQRVIVGPTASGGSMEVMYTRTGVIQGLGAPGVGAPFYAPISGEWKTDDGGRICTAMRIGTGGIVAGASGLTLPARCQYWYRHDQQYFFSDSDFDRSARVFRRTVKP